MKWREEAVAACGDVEKMFNQVMLTERDQVFHRFLWRDGDESLPISIYQWMRLIFGDKPSPDLATYAIRFLADGEALNYPKGAGILKEKTYVDDVTFSDVNSECVAEAIKEVDVILSKGNLEFQ